MSDDKISGFEDCRSPKKVHNMAGTTRGFSLCTLDIKIVNYSRV